MGGLTLSSTYDIIYDKIRQLRYDTEPTNSIINIEYMLEESVTDSDLSLSEYIQLKSELDYEKKRCNR